MRRLYVKHVRLTAGWRFAEPGRLHSAEYGNGWAGQLSRHTRVREVETHTVVCADREQRHTYKLLALYVSRGEPSRREGTHENYTREMRESIVPCGYCAQIVTKGVSERVLRCCFTLEKRVR